jgi:hypothetical protein
LGLFIEGFEVYEFKKLSPTVLDDSNFVVHARPSSTFQNGGLPKLGRVGGTQNVMATVICLTLTIDTRIH